MKFHLNHIPARPLYRIDHSNRLFLIGSCFSENIGKKMKDHRFNVFMNPGGIVFNPHSISKCLRMALDEEGFDERFIFERDGSYHSYLHHSSITAASKRELQEKIHTGNNAASEELRSCDFLFITFGSAWYYEHVTLNAPVANCHKQPSNLFTKKLMGLPEMVKDYSGLILSLQKVNPKMQIIFTVSPVKHLKDGVVENSLSKSLLIMAAHELINVNKNCFYFPAYELVNDDLRDYRFYKKDLAHPNELAIDYIWEKFSHCFFENKTIELNKKVSELNAAASHRKMNESETESRALSEYISRQKTEIQKLHPGIKL